VARRLLIVGSEGFVGRRLMAAFAAAGDEVFGADRAVPEGDSRRISCDITDPAQVEALIARAGPLDGVFHLAAISHVGEAMGDPARVMRVNVEGTLHVAEALLRRCPKARLIFASTAQVYGPPRELPVTEAHPLAPANPYAISKAAADALLGYLHKARGLDVVRLRLYNHSGPGQSPDFVLPSFARQIARIEAGLQPPVMRVGNLDVRRDFTHIDDIVRAYAAALDRGRAGEVYNVCSGVGRSIREALDWMIAHSGRAIAVETDPDRLRPVEVTDDCGDAARFTAHTGWNPEKDFDELLLDLLEDWRKRIIELIEG
jgi:GDP-4-dehydro-6-deoxy-D-mannose reductase